MVNDRTEIDDSADEISGRPMIFTTGAFLSPHKFTLNNGEIWWGWIVEEFIDNSYLNGEAFNPPEVKRTKAELVINETSLGE